MVIDLTLEDNDDHVTCVSKCGVDTPTAVSLTDESDADLSSAPNPNVLSHASRSRCRKRRATGESGDGEVKEPLQRRTVRTYREKLISRVYDTSYHPVDDFLYRRDRRFDMQSERRRRKRTLRHDRFCA